MGRWAEVMGDRELWRECLWRKPLAATGRRTAEPCAGDRAITQAFFLPLTRRSTADQQRKTNREGGPLSACCTKLQRRTSQEALECQLPETSFLKAPYLLHLWLLASWCTWCPQVSVIKAAMPPLCSALTGAEFQRLGKAPNSAISPTPMAISFPANLALTGLCDSSSHTLPCPLFTGAGSNPQRQPQEQTCG